MAFRVLVADDASFIRDTIKRNLRPLIPDAEVFEAVDGRKAVSIVKTKKIDLILSDWEMPELSGEEFVRWLRSESQFASIPFVMVTSRGDRDHVIAAINAGVSDYLSKPFTPEELHKKVAKQLKRLGYKSGAQAAAGSSSGGFSSLDVLTGGKKSAPAKSKEVKSAGGAFAKATAPKTSAVAAQSQGNFQGSANLRFANGAAQCSIRDLSLQGVSGFIQRGETLPTIFDQAAVDLEDAKGNALARLNGYVHAIFAAETRPDSQRLKISIRFVDNDPEKFEVLSKAIAGN